MAGFMGRNSGGWVRLSTQEVSGVSTLAFENEWQSASGMARKGQYFREDIDIFRFQIINLEMGTNHATLCWQINRDTSTGGVYPPGNPDTGFNDSEFLTAACQFWNSGNSSGAMGYTPDSDLIDEDDPIYLAREVKAHTTTSGSNAGGNLTIWNGHMAWRGISYSSDMASISDNGAVHFESAGSTDTISVGTLDGVQFSTTSGTFSGKFVLYGLGEGGKNIH